MRRIDLLAHVQRRRAFLRRVVRKLNRVRLHRNEHRTLLHVHVVSNGGRFLRNHTVVVVIDIVRSRGSRIHRERWCWFRHESKFRPSLFLLLIRISSMAPS